MSPTQYFARSSFEDHEIARAIMSGKVEPWRQSRTEWWFRFVKPDNAKHRVEARRDPQIRERDEKISAAIQAGFWPQHIPASSIGETQVKRLIADGHYEIWRIDSRGCLWIRKVEFGHSGK